jgi:Phosphoesterase family
VKKTRLRRGALTMLASIGVMAGLSACGSSDNGPSGPQVTGQVLGSYIQGAAVCLDVNNNGKCDQGEPVARSDAQGKFSITDTSNGSWKYVVADLNGATENDASGKNMGTAFNSTATFRSPRGVSSVSAITTQLSQLIDSGLSQSDAQTQLASKIGTTSDTLLGDFNTNGNAAVKAASDQYIATVASSKAIKHVWVIVLENKSAASTYGTTASDSNQDPYLKSLMPQGTYLANYYGTGHVSLDNYVSMISGQPSTHDTETDCFQIWSDIVDDGNDSLNPKVLKAGTDVNGHQGGGCVFPARVQHIGNQVEAAKLTWRSYNEDMGNNLNRDGTKTCSFPRRTAQLAGTDPTKAVDGTQAAQAPSASGDVVGDEYATRHNPFVYFHSSIDDLANCDTHVVNVQDNLATDLQSIDTTPNFSFITPNLCDDGHDGDGTGNAGKGCANGQPGGLTSIDAFLKKTIPMIQASAAYKQDGLIIITTDEGVVAGLTPTTQLSADGKTLSLLEPEQGDQCPGCNQQTGPNVTRPEQVTMSTLPVAEAGMLGINPATLPASVQNVSIALSYVGVGGDQVGTLLLSPFIKGGHVDNTGYNHYALLHSLEDNFGMGSYLGYADDASLQPIFTSANIDNR